MLNLEPNLLAFWSGKWWNMKFNHREVVFSKVIDADSAWKQGNLLYSSLKLFYSFEFLFSFFSYFIFCGNNFLNINGCDHIPSSIFTSSFASCQRSWCPLAVLSGNSGADGSSEDCCSCFKVSSRMMISFCALSNEKTKILF